MRLQILLVDDHLAFAEAIGSLLEREGWEARVSASLDSAERVLEEWAADILILDIGFSGFERSGFDLARQLTTRVYHPSVIFLTMYADAAHQRAARESGAVGFLGKGDSAARIIEAIHAVEAGGTWFRDLAETWGWGPTPRQLTVIRYLDRGLHYDQIATAMHCEERTIRFHVERARAAVGAKTCAELVSIARQHGWLFLPNSETMVRPRLATPEISDP